jgi:hypothetical protein
MRAAGVEMATGGPVDRPGHVADHVFLGAPDRWIGRRHARHERLGVRVRRPGEDRCLIGVLDDPAEVPVQRGVAILENQLHAPAQHPQFGRRQSSDVVAIETNCPAGRLDQAKNGSFGGGISAATFADEA